MSNIKDAITKINKELMEAFHTKTASWMAKLYAPDALLMPPGFEAVSGEENICLFWQSIMDMGITDVELKTTTLDEPEGEAVTTVTEIGEFQLRNSDGELNKGKYLVVWKLVEGEWRLFRDIWNSDSQPAK